jgi:hypothetical protein
VLTRADYELALPVVARSRRHILYTIPAESP